MVYANDGARAAFRAAATSVLGAPGSSGPLSAEVRALLEHWSSAPEVPLARARALWVADAERFAATPKVRQRADRASVLRYEATGDVLPGAAAVGSLTMFSIPPLLSQTRRALEESIFGVFSIEVLAAQRLLSPSFFAAAVTLLTVRVAQLVSLCTRGGGVTIEAHHEAVGLGLPATSRIRARRPWTMSWSNVGDYMRGKEFLDTARACSAVEDTVHYAYSMNFATHVLGAFLCDHPAGIRRDMLKRAREGEVQIFRSVGLEPFVHIPMPQNAVNTCAFGLFIMAMRSWGEHLFAGSGVGERSRRVQPSSGMLSTRGPVARVTFTFDETINFEEN